MKNNKIQTIAPDGYYIEYSPELIEQGIARGRQLQGKAMGDAIVALYRWLRYGRPEPKQARLGKTITVQ